MKYVTLLLMFPIYMACNQKYPNYADFAFHGDTLWALNTRGRITPFELKTGKEIFLPFFNRDTITRVSCDRNGQLYICDNNNVIKKYSIAYKFPQTIYNSPTNVAGITFDSQNNGYIITTSGIVDLSTQQLFKPDIQDVEYPWIRHPQYAMDQLDNLWLGFNFGGTRGAIYIFNTRSKTFFQPDSMPNLDIANRPIVSFFHGKTDGDMYAISKDTETSSLIQFTHYKGTVLTNTEKEVKLRTGFFYQGNIYVGNNLGEINQWVKGEWKNMVPAAAHKGIKRIYADDNKFAYITGEEELIFKGVFQ